MLRKNKRVIEAMSHVLEFNPHEAQQRVIDAFIADKRFLVFIAGRRAGKTEIAAIMATYALGESGCKIRCVAQYYRLAKRLWDKTVPMVRKLYYGKNISINKSDMVISTPWGSILELCSAENPDSLLGEGCDLIIVDEAALLKPEIWQQYISPSIRDRKGTVLFISTPRGKNWLYDCYIKGLSGEDGWWSHRTASWVNQAVWTDDEIALVRSQTDSMYLSQEFEAEFINFSGRVYNEFKESEHILQQTPDTDNWEHYVTIDPGYATQAAILWGAYNRVTDTLVIYDELCDKELGFDAILDAIKEREPDGGYSGFVCDIAARARSQETGRSFVTWMNESKYFLDNDYHFTSYRSARQDGIALVRQMLKPLDQIAKLLVYKECKTTIRAALNYCYKDNSEEPVHDEHSHSMDSLRYLVYHLRKGRREMGFIRL